MWLACYTQAEIADAVGLSQKEISIKTEELYQMEGLPKGIKLSANHDTEFEPPLYNIWRWSAAAHKKPSLPLGHDEE